MREFVNHNKSNKFAEQFALSLDLPESILKNSEFNKFLKPLSKVIIDDEQKGTQGIIELDRVNYKYWLVPFFANTVTQPFNVDVNEFKIGNQIRNPKKLTQGIYFEMISDSRDEILTEDQFLGFTNILFEESLESLLNAPYASLHNEFVKIRKINSNGAQKVSFYLLDGTWVLSDYVKTNIYAYRLTDAVNLSFGGPCFKGETKTNNCTIFLHKLALNQDFYQTVKPRLKSNDLTIKELMLSLQTKFREQNQAKNKPTAPNRWLEYEYLVGRIKTVYPLLNPFEICEKLEPKNRVAKLPFKNGQNIRLEDIQDSLSRNMHNDDIWIASK